MSIKKLADGSLMISGFDVEPYRLIAICKAIRTEARARKVGMRLNNGHLYVQAARDILAANGRKPQREIASLAEQWERFLFDSGIFQN